MQQGAAAAHGTSNSEPRSRLTHAGQHLTFVWASLAGLEGQVQQIPLPHQSSTRPAECVLGLACLPLERLAQLELS